MHQLALVLSLIPLPSTDYREIARTWRLFFATLLHRLIQLFGLRGSPSAIRGISGPGTTADLSDVAVRIGLGVRTCSATPSLSEQNGRRRWNAETRNRGRRFSAPTLTAIARSAAAASSRPPLAVAGPNAGLNHASGARRAAGFPRAR